MCVAIGHGTRSHHTAQHDPSAPLSGDGRSSSCARASHTGTRGRPRRRPSRCMRPGRGSRRAHAAARGPSRPPFAHTRPHRSAAGHRCAARAAAAVRARGKRVSARAALVRDGSRGQRSCVWACSGGSGMSMRASPVDLCARRRRPQRSVSACSMEHSAGGSRPATILCAAQTACGQGSGVGSARSRRLTSTSAYGWQEPSPSANAHEPVTRVMLARESEPRGRVPGRPASPGRAG